MDFEEQVRAEQKRRAEERDRVNALLRESENRQRKQEADQEAAERAILALARELGRPVQTLWISWSNPPGLFRRKPKRRKAEIPSIVGWVLTWKTYDEYSYNSTTHAKMITRDRVWYDCYNDGVAYISGQTYGQPPDPTPTSPIQASVIVQIAADWRSETDR